MLMKKVMKHLMKKGKEKVGERREVSARGWWKEWMKMVDENVWWKMLMRKVEMRKVNENFWWKCW